MQTSTFMRAKARPIRLSAVCNLRKICFLPHKLTLPTAPKSMFSRKFCQIFHLKEGDQSPIRVIGQQHSLNSSNSRH